MTRVLFPSFELIGPPCPVAGCSGVLVGCLQVDDLSRTFYSECSECRGRVERRIVDLSDPHSILAACAEVGVGAVLDESLGGS